MTYLSGNVEDDLNGTEVNRAQRRQELRATLSYVSNRAEYTEDFSIDHCTGENSGWGSRMCDRRRHRVPLAHSKVRPVLNMDIEFSVILRRNLGIYHTTTINYILLLLQLFLHIHMYLSMYKLLQTSRRRKQKMKKKEKRKQKRHQTKLFWFLYTYL